MQPKYPACILLLFLTSWATGQNGTAKSPYGSYFFEGDDVVFEFDLRTYEQAARSADSSAVDFGDLPIRELGRSGAFNGWSAEGWKMERVDQYRFRLRKQIRDFTDALNWQFRFLLHGVPWAPPEGAPAKQGMLGRYDLKNPNAPIPSFGDTGNVVFRLHGFAGRKQVILSGTFNDWDEQAIRMKPANGGWEIRMSLGPGIYEYKFIADGEWLHDPANPEKRQNQHGTFNSVLRVTSGVPFRLEGFADAREVMLAGSFNDWNDRALPMRQTPAGWITEVPLVAGKHLYKFIVDGRWITDPANRRVETDLHGNVNSVIFVR